MHDWFRVLQILQSSNGPGDDVLLQRAWKHVGDYFMERQKWYVFVEFWVFSTFLGKVPQSTTNTDKTLKNSLNATL